MKRRPLIVAAAAFGVSTFGLMNVIGSTAAQAPGPTSGEVIAEDLLGTIGAAIGPDGALYVAEGGTGGTDVFELPDGSQLLNGMTGQVTRIDPATGAKTVVAEGIPSVGFGDGSGSGATDVAFIGDDMYVLLTGVGAISGFPDYPNGIYRVEDDGDLELVDDIGTFNDENPVDLPDAAPGGNPFSFTPYGDDAFIVTDGNFNRVLLAGLDGDIETVVQLGNVVPTGTATDGADAYFTEFGSEGSSPEKGKVLRVNFSTNSATEIASGFPNLIDIEQDAAGNWYALSMGDMADESAGAPAVPFTGKILLVNGDGTLTPIVDGLMLPTSLDISGETAFVTSLTGSVVRIEDLDNLDPLPTPTPETPTATVTAATPTATSVPPTATATSVPPTATATTKIPLPPNTGNGATGDGGYNWLLLVIGGAIVAASSGAYAYSTRRR